MGRIRLRDAFAALAIALLITGALMLPALAVLRGMSIDVLTGLRWRAFGQLHDPSSSPTVVIAFDEDTYRTPPFAGTPQVAWTREVARVLTAAIDANAKVVGFDVIFPTSMELSDISVGEETLGARMRGFDRDFLRALKLGADAGKVVLGQVQHSAQPILPSRAQQIVVGQG